MSLRYEAKTPPSPVGQSNITLFISLFTSPPSTSPPALPLSFTSLSRGFNALYIHATCNKGDAEISLANLLSCLGNGRCLLCVPGFFLPHKPWLRNLKVFATCNKSISMDLIGGFVLSSFGESVVDVCVVVVILGRVVVDIYIAVVYSSLYVLSTPLTSSTPVSMHDVI